MILWFHDPQETPQSAISPGLCTVLPHLEDKPRTAAVWSTFPEPRQKVPPSQIGKLKHRNCWHVAAVCQVSPFSCTGRASLFRPASCPLISTGDGQELQDGTKPKARSLWHKGLLLEGEISWFCLAGNKAPQALLFSLSPHPLGFSFSDSSVSWRGEQMRESVPLVNEQHYIHSLVWFCSYSLPQWCRWEGINFIEDNSVN